MNAYDKLRQRNIAERNAILAKIFKDLTDKKPKQHRQRVKKQNKILSNDGNTDELEIKNKLSKKKSVHLAKFDKLVETKEYYLRVRSAKPEQFNILPDSSISEQKTISCTPRKRNPCNTYKTRSWYRQNKNQNEKDIIPKKNNMVSLNNISENDGASKRNVIIKTDEVYKNNDLSKIVVVPEKYVASKKNIIVEDIEMQENKEKHK